MPFPATDLPDKKCAACGATFNRKRFPSGLQDIGCYRRQRFCSLKCSARASMRETVSLAGLRKRSEVAIPLGPCCESCGSTEQRQRHHLDQNPRNNSPENLQTLCASCHAKWHWAHGKLDWSAARSRVSAASASSLSETAWSRKSRNSSGGRSSKSKKGGGE